MRGTGKEMNMPKIPAGLALGPEDFESKPMSQTTNLRDLRLSQDFENMTDVTKIVTSVSIGKPGPQTFFRVRPDEQAIYPVFEKKQDFKSEFFIVDTKAVPELASEVAPRLIVPVITRDGNLFVWPLRMGTPEKEADLAARSAYAAMQKAKSSWVRLKWKGREFECSVAKGDLPEPEWPDITFDEMLDLAFAGQVIDSANHPVVRALNGEL
jgi:hypothetical protein